MTRDEEKKLDVDDKMSVVVSCFLLVMINNFCFTKCGDGWSEGSGLKFSLKFVSPASSLVEGWMILFKISVEVATFFFIFMAEYL